MKIILASSSIGRKKILESLDLEFAVVPANIDEDQFTASNSINLVKDIAKAKALAVLTRITSQPPKETYLIIAADSLVYFAGKTFGKPKTKNEAKNFLHLLSGKTHEFLTGLCIINTETNKIYQTHAETKVIFEKLTAKEIDDYVKIAPVTSFAGAYSLEQNGAEILRPKIKVLGSKTNVLGLPLEKLLPIFKKIGGQDLKIKLF